jgi:uncharacterized protein YjbI with pentapeptide repeats
VENTPLTVTLDELLDQYVCEQAVADFSSLYGTDKTFSWTIEEQVSLLRCRLARRWLGAGYRREMCPKIIVRGVDLKEIDLSQSDLGRCDLRESDLQRADLSESNLAYADFSSTNLTSANFEASNCARTNFARSNLRNANFHDANLTSADFRGADISGANFTDAHLLLAHMDEAPAGWVLVNGRCKRA